MTQPITSLERKARRIDRAINAVTEPSQRLELAQAWLQFRVELEQQVRVEVSPVNELLAEAYRRNTVSSNNT